MRIIIETPDGDQAHDLTKGTTLIGRESACSIRIHDPSVSRRHLECTLTADTCVARDLNTKNGTYLGPQRVEEVQITPGLRLCLGKVYVRFEQESAPQPAEPLPIPPLPAIEPIPAQAVPFVGDDFEQDDEPTPLDEDVAQSVLADAAGKGTRLVVRGKQWFVQDAATGAEVEIVPQQGTGQPAMPGDNALPGDAAPAPTSLMPMVVTRQPGTASAPPAKPATAIPLLQAFNLKTLLANPRKRRWVLIAALGFILLLILTMTSFKAPKEPEAISSPRYSTLIDEALHAFQQGNRDESLATLEKLRETPVQGRHKLAEILLDAMKADARSVADFRAAWEEAQVRWEEAHDSAEATTSTRDLAQSRLDWITLELENMLRANEATALLQSGDLSASLDRAAQIPEDSLFRAEAESLIAETVTTVIGAAEKKAAAAVTTQKWADAIASLEEIKKYDPSRASDVDPRIEIFELRLTEEAAIAQARKLAAENHHTEAIELLRSIADDSPYAKAVATMKTEYALAGTQYNAMAAYASGDGKKALAKLAQGGLGESALARKIQKVMEHRENADKALEANDFDKVTRALMSLRAIEADEKNKYGRDARRQLDSMEQLRTSHARRLMTKAETANRNRNFAEARSSYLDAIRVDPNTRTAAFAELKNFEKAAVDDYNKASALEKQHPERALKLYQDVMARLAPGHRFYRNAELRILELELNMALEEVPPSQPDPE